MGNTLGTSFGIKSMAFGIMRLRKHLDSPDRKASEKNT